MPFKTTVNWLFNEIQCYLVIGCFDCKICVFQKPVLSNLKTKINKLDVDKLVPVPVDLSKLSDIVKNDVVRNDVYNAKSKILKIKDLLLLT